MGCTAAAFTPSPAPPGCLIREADTNDLDAVVGVGVDSVASESDPAAEREWGAPHLTAEEAPVALAVVDGEPVGTAYSLRADGRAGPSVYLAGVAVLLHARGRGIGGAISSWLIHRVLAYGAQLAHLHPDTEAAARIYARLGFDEVSGFDVYMEN